MAGAQVNLVDAVAHALDNVTDHAVRVMLVAETTVVSYKVLAHRALLALEVLVPVVVTTSVLLVVLQLATCIVLARRPVAAHKFDPA